MIAHSQLTLTVPVLKHVLKSWKPWPSNAMCRSTLEYAAPIWDPYQTTDMKKFDKIQRHGARFVTRNYSRSTWGEQIVKDLKWEDLSTRRYHSRLILFYHINKQVAIPFVKNQFIVPGSRGRFHAHTLKHIGYKHSYYPQTIRDWNYLQGAVPAWESSNPDWGSWAASNLTLHPPRCNTWKGFLWSIVQKQKQKNIWFSI